MKILLDVTALMRRDLTGIGVYVKSLHDHLRARSDLSVSGCWKLSRFKGRHLLRLHLSEEGNPCVPFLSDLNPGGFDLFHGPDFRIPRRGRFAKVVTVHDLVIHEPGLVDERFAREGIAKLRHTLVDCHPDRIITVSRFTRAKLIEYYPDLEPITVAVPLGVDHVKFLPRKQNESFPIPSGRYLLAAGTVEKRKNLMNVIHAFEIVRRRERDLQLVIAGGRGHGAEEIDARIERSPDRDAILRLGFVSDEMLVSLYRDTIALLYPSLYEGFGIPILEAMATGCPVITSNIGAMAEAAGDAALLVDPRNPAEIASAMEMMIDNTMLRERLVAAGLERARAHTWERCAEETVRVYRDACVSR